MKTSPDRNDTTPAGKPVPGRQAGLGNPLRPGLGTSTGNHGMENPRPGRPAAAGEVEGSPKATPHAYEEPRPEPREQPPDSFNHEIERSTGVSGHSGSS